MRNLTQSSIKKDIWIHLGSSWRLVWHHKFQYTLSKKTLKIFKGDASKKTRLIFQCMICIYIYIQYISILYYDGIPKTQWVWNPTASSPFSKITIKFLKSTSEPKPPRRYHHFFILIRVSWATRVAKIKPEESPVPTWHWYEFKNTSTSSSKGCQGWFTRDPQGHGTPENGKRDPYHSHIFRDSNMGVGLGNSMGPAYHKGVPLLGGPWKSHWGCPESKRTNGEPSPSKVPNIGISNVDPFICTYTSVHNRPLVHQSNPQVWGMISITCGYKYIHMSDMYVYLWYLYYIYIAFVLVEVIPFPQKKIVVIYKWLSTWVFSPCMTWNLFHFPARVLASKKLLNLGHVFSHPCSFNRAALFGRLIHRHR